MAAMALVKIARACWKPSEATAAVTLVKIARAERIAQTAPALVKIARAERVAQTAPLFSRLVTSRCKRGQLCPTLPQ